MVSGLFALLDDIAAIARLAAASLDDVAGAAAQAGAKAAGVVIDDMAVTPRYVTGLSPARELPIIAKIARGSLFNKIVILLPVALLLSALAPWAIVPLLMAGGSYLCFEAAEKLLEAGGLVAVHGEGDVGGTDAADLERAQVAGAVRTDFILSAEIMAIALGELTAKPVWEQGVVLAMVAVAITAGVYGIVAVIVKMDDVGLRLARTGTAGIAAVGRGLVTAMPRLLWALSGIGTAAMAWVGGGIVVHGLDVAGITAPAHLVHDAAAAAGGGAPRLGRCGGAVGGVRDCGRQLYRRRHPCRQPRTTPIALNGSGSSGGLSGWASSRCQMPTSIHWPFL